jgi:PST family polysaccharide transporter
MSLRGRDELTGAAAGGAAIMLAAQGARVVLQAVSVATLGRLLGASDFGVIAMVTAVVGIGGLIRDFGLGQAAVQAKAITSGQRSNLFWINTLAGATISAIVFLSAPAVGAMYGRPGLEPVVRALSVTFLLGGLVTQFRAELSRALRFRRLAAAEIAAQGLGVVAAISAALLGAGLWALVIQQLTEQLMLALLTGLVCGWRPGRPTREPMGGLLRFGSNLVGTQSIVYLSQNVDSFVIGRRFGSSPLGEYNRAFQLLMLPINQISAPATKVALPVLARLQDSRDRFRAYLLRANLLIGYVVAFGLLLCASQAEAVVHLALGSGWSASADIFRILAVAGCFQTLSYATFWSFLAHGRTASNMRFTLISRSFLVAAILAGSTWGVAGVAAAYSIGLALIWPAGLLWVRTFAPSRPLFTQGLRILACSAVAAAGSLATLSVSADLAAILQFGMGTAAALLVLGILFVVLPKFRADMREVRSTVTVMTRGRRGKPAAAVPPQRHPSDQAEVGI